MSNRKPLNREQILAETGLGEMTKIMEKLDPDGTSAVMRDLDRVLNLYNIAHQDVGFEDSEKILRMSMGAQKCLADIALDWIYRGYKAEGIEADQDNMVRAGFLFGMCWGYVLKEMDLEEFDD